MALVLTGLRVVNFRNYESFFLEPDPSLTILVGANAVGKTNLVEAIQLMTSTESFRKPAWADVVRWGADKALVEMRAEGDERKLEMLMEVSAGGRREYRVNGKLKRKLSEVAGVIPSVIFTPDDLRLVKDSAERRRTAIDSVGTQLSSSYATLKNEYERALRQRNALLRQEDVAGESFAVWTGKVVELGASFSTHRRRLFDRLARVMSEVYETIASDGPLVARYVASWERDGFGDESDDPTQAIRAHLNEKQKEEASRRTTVSGPHRDEITFSIAGKDARAFASQGQQRTIALAWKIAEVRVVSQIASQPPVLLLDDVMSELDQKRRTALAAHVGSEAQTIVTTANLAYFEDQMIKRSKVVALG